MSIFFPPVLSKRQAAYFASCLAWKFPQLSQRLNGRIESAVKIISAPCSVIYSRELPGCYEIVVGENRTVLVDPARKTCTCQLSGLGEICEHRVAIALWKDGPAWATEKQEFEIRNGGLHVH